MYNSRYLVNLLGRICIRLFKGTVIFLVTPDIFGMGFLGGLGDVIMFSDQNLISLYSPKDNIWQK